MAVTDIKFFRIICTTISTYFKCKVTTYYNELMK